MLLIKTDYDGSPWIEAGKVYEAALVKSGKYEGMYKFMGELGSPVYTRLKRSCHIGQQDWEILQEIIQ